MVIFSVLGYTRLIELPVELNLTSSFDFYLPSPVESLYAAVVSFTMFWFNLGEIMIEA